LKVFAPKTWKRYYKSFDWHITRNWKLEVQPLCEHCGQKAQQVHHKHYDSIGAEKNEELVSVCLDCHRRLHSGKHF